MDIFQLCPGRDKLLLLPWDHCLLQTRYFNTITRPGHPGHSPSTLLKWIGQKGPKNKRQCEKCWICFGFFSYCCMSVHPDTGCSGQSVHSHNLGVKSQHDLYRILDMFGWNVAIRYPGVWQPNSIECILVDCIWWWAQEILVAQCCRLIVWDVVVDCDLEMLHYWHLPSPSPCFPGVQL